MTLHRLTLSRIALWRPGAVPLAIVLALGLLLAACGGNGDEEAAQPSPPPSPAAEEGTQAPAETPAGETAFPRTVEDSAGAPVTLEARPLRIVSLSPGATEVLFAIGAGDRVVAVDDFSYYPPEAQTLPKLAYSNPDPEAVLAHDPDLVIMSGRQSEQVAQFRSLGLTVLFLDEASRVEGVLDNIGLLGEITGNDDEASALAAEMRGRIDAVRAAITDVEEGPRVYFELDAGLFTASPDTFVGDLLTLLRAGNVAEGAETAFPQLTAEAIIEADPEVILLADAAFGESRETVCGRPGWDAVTACREGRVYPVDPDLTNRPGPRVVDGLEQVAALLYPERFE